MHLLPVVGRFAHRMCLPPPGAVRSLRWGGMLLIGIVLITAGVPSSRLVAAELSIPTVMASAGDRVNASVVYSAQGATVAGLQFDLKYDRSVLTITATAGSATTGAGKSLTTAVLPNGNLRFLIFGFNQNVIADGIVVNLTIQVNPSSSAGPYTLGFFNTSGVAPTGKSVSISTHDGQIIIRDTTPPMITVSANPTTLWPPNGKMVPVTVSGTMTDNEPGGTGVNASTVAYAVTDEYGQVQPKGGVTLKADGSYSFIIQLQASRNGDDLDGRQYTITVSAQDNAGNKGSAATGVTVPHDQGH